MDLNLTDMDGNPVTIKDLCAGHKVTMINCRGACFVTSVQKITP